MRLCKKLIYLTLLVSVFFACQKDDCNKKDINYYVSNTDKKMLPYSGYDTLTYVRTNIGDTHTFIGTGMKKTYDIQSETADCGNTFYYENYFYTYKSNNFNDLIIGQFTNNNVSCFSYVDFNNQHFQGALYLNEANLDSIILTNMKYYYVQFIPDARPIETKYKAFFNKDYGCIKMVFTNGDTWELLNFKK